MPAHKAPKAADRTTDRLANVAVATFVVLAAVGIATDAIARPRPVSRRDDWLDDLIGDVEHPDKGAQKLAGVFEPHHHPKPQKPASAPRKPAKHRKPAEPAAKPHKRPERPPHRHPIELPDPASVGRHHTARKLRIPAGISRLIRELTETPNMPSWQHSSESNRPSSTSGEHSPRWSASSGNEPTT